MRPKKRLKCPLHMFKDDPEAVKEMTMKGQQLSEQLILVSPCLRPLRRILNDVAEAPKEMTTRPHLKIVFLLT